MNRDNLATLAAYLESLPIDYTDFDMEDFIDPKLIVNMDLKIKYALENGGVGAVCGTVACAVGHGPSAGFLFQQDEIRDEGNAFERPDWWSYILRVFGLDSRELEFLWMFGSAWVDVDNTHRGAAARIRYLLDNGLPKIFDNHDYSSFLPDGVDASIYKAYLV